MDIDSGNLWCRVRRWDMSELKHTPGPWIIRKTGDTGWPGQQGYTIEFNEDQEQVVGFVYKEADASLISAAPELLGALVYLMAIADGSGRERYIQFQLTPEFLEPARAAIAKATGKSK